MSGGHRAGEDQARAQRVAGERVSVMWAELRDSYVDEVRELVDRIHESGGMTMRDLILLEFAEHETMGFMLAQDNEDAPLGDRLVERLTSMRLQSRKHLGRLLDAIGDTGGANEGPAPVPEDVEAAIAEADPNDVGDFEVEG